MLGNHELGDDRSADQPLRGHRRRRDRTSIARTAGTGASSSSTRPTPSASSSRRSCSIRSSVRWCVQPAVPIRQINRARHRHHAVPVQQGASRASSRAAFAASASTSSSRPFLYSFQSGQFLGRIEEELRAPGVVEPRAKEARRSSTTRRYSARPARSSASGTASRSRSRPVRSTSPAPWSTTASTSWRGRSRSRCAACTMAATAAMRRRTSVAAVSRLPESDPRL